MDLHQRLTFPFFNQLAFQGNDNFIPTLKERLNQYKVVHLSQVPNSVDLFNFYGQLNQSLGHLIRKGEDLEQQTGFTNNQWLDVRYDPRHANTYRHSNTRQPLHTDGAYITSFNFDIVFLFCTEQATSGGETVFVDADDLVALLKNKAPDLLDQLQRREVIFGKGNFGIKKEKIIDRDDRGWLLNWNHHRIAADNSNAIKEMTATFHHFLETEIVETERFTPVLLKKGECVYFTDRRVLHGRKAFQGDRCLIKGALTI